MNHTSSHITAKAPTFTLNDRVAVHLALLAVVLVQVVLREFISLWGVAPSLIIAATVFLALQLGPRAVVACALIAGLVFDLLSYHILGSSAFALCLTAWLVGFVRGLVFRQTLLLYLATICGATVVYTITISIINWLARGEGVMVLHLLWQIPLSCALNFIALLVLIPILKRVLKGRLSRG